MQRESEEYISIRPCVDGTKVCSRAGDADDIVTLGKIMRLEVKQDDFLKLVEEYGQELEEKKTKQSLTLNDMREVCIMWDRVQAHPSKAIAV